MVAERKGVSRLGSKEPARTRRPPPVLPQQQGDTRVPRHTKLLSYTVLDLRSAKTDWQCRPALAS